MEAYYSRAIVRENLGDKQGALTDYNIYLESRPEDKEALFSRAVSRYDFGQWAAAHEDFIKLLGMPEGGETNKVYFQTNQSTDGVTKAFTAHHHLHATLYNYLGLIELKLKNPRQALHYFDSAINRNPKDPDLLLHHGLAQLENGDTTNAIKDLEMVLILNPESSQARLNLAVLKKTSPQSSDTEILLSEAIEKNPTLPYAYSERGLLRMKSGNLQGALEDYNQAVSLNPTDPDNWLNRGLIKEQQKDFNGALADYQQAISVKTDYEKAWLNHGNALVKLNRLAEAIEDYSVAITYYPDYGLAFYNRALTYHRLGKKSEGCKDIREALRLGVMIETKVINTLCK